ncbi:hypothetical protein D8I24_5814 [Cupriavidus necator H850]|nr:hypothetical protein D8I24_5814 [Cupriavidus necator H850]
MRPDASETQCRQARRRCATRDFTTPAPAPDSGKAPPRGIGAQARIRHAPRVYSRTPFQ